MLFLAVFLGNPGAQYIFNRHNAGRHLAEKLPFFSSLVWKKKFNGLASIKTLDDGITRHFLVPETYMNLSGRSVRAAAAFHKIQPEKIIVVHDELELTPGTVSLKFSGGLGGHNGLRSIKQELGTADFWRIRIGIGRPPGRLPGEGGALVKGIHDGGDGEIARWVLSDFTPAEKPALDAALEAGAELLVQTLTTEEPESLLLQWKKVCLI
jgi:PTH1 family peptidyl-tRNA hydrolase